MENTVGSFFLDDWPIEMTLQSFESAKLPIFLGSSPRGVIEQALHSDTETYNYLSHFEPVLKC